MARQKNNDKNNMYKKIIKKIWNLLFVGWAERSEAQHLRWISWSNKNALGLDINDGYLRFVQLSIKKGKYYLEDYFVVNRKASLEIDLKAARSKLKKPPKRVIIAIPTLAVISKELQVPVEFNESEIENLLELNLEHYIPYPKEEVNWDFQQDPNDRGKILLTACRKELLNNLVKAVSSVGFAVQIAEVEAYAIERAFINSINEATTHSSIILILHLSTTMLDVMLYEQGKIIFTHSDNLHQSLTSEQIILQVQRSLQLYSIDAFEKLEQVFLAGDSVALTDLLARLKLKFKFSVQILNPFLDMRKSPHIIAEELNHIAGSLLLSYGLAMRGIYAVHN